MAKISKPGKVNCAYCCCWTAMCWMDRDEWMDTVGWSQDWGEGSWKSSEGALKRHTSIERTCKERRRRDRSKLEHLATPRKHRQVEW
jgi:hypothetical protein